MNAPDPKANTTTEAYLAYKAGYLEESELKPKLYEPYLHFDAWLAYWSGLTNDYPTDKNGNPEMLTDEEALVAYLSGVTNTYPEEIKDPYDVRIVGYLRHLASIRWPEPDYPVNNKEFYLSTMEPTHTSNSEPSADIELDTTEGNIISVEAYGDTFQQTYSGKNLFNKNSTPQATYQATATTLDTGIKVTCNNTINYQYVRYLYSVENNVGDTFTLSVDASASSSNTPAIGIGTCDADGGNRTQKAIKSGSGSLSVSYTIETGVQYIYIVFYANHIGTAEVGDYTDYANVQMEFGSGATPYEPYVGGVPAPNPDYPQDVNVVTGEQIITANGKNICSECKTGNANKLLYFRLPHLSSDKIVLSATLSVPLIGNTYGLELDGTFTQLGTWSTSAGNKLERAFSLTDAQVQAINNSTEAWIRTYKSAGGFEIPSDAMIEYGTDASAYEPYQSQSYTINLGSTELCKIGDYQDYIYKSGDEWYVHKEIGKVVYDGTENWAFGTASALRVLVEIETNMQPYTTSALCSHLVYGNTASASQNNVFNIGSSKVYAKATAITTSADSWKTWLATHNVSLYYQLAAPTDTKITDATLVGQLEALAGADTYNEKTFIKVTATDPNLPALLKVEAYKY